MTPSTTLIQIAVRRARVAEQAGIRSAEACQRGWQEHALSRLSQESANLYWAEAVMRLLEALGSK